MIADTTQVEEKEQSGATGSRLFDRLKLKATDNANSGGK